MALPKKHTNVLIVGAGPTGLMLACQLATRGISFRIIDRNAGPSDKSKAIVVQARTLEILEQMGIVAEALEAGHAATGLNFIVKGRWVQNINLQGIGEGQSPYPYMCILEQSKTEQLLLQYLEQYHIAVEWNTTLHHLKQTEKQIKALLHFKDTNQEEITCDWLVGADGASSRVRHLLDVDFIGGTYEHTFLVADTQVDWDFNHDEMFVCLANKTLAAFFPMAGHKRFRVVSFLPPHLQYRDDLTFDRIAPSLQKQLGFKVRFSNTNWFSTYKLHHRYAKQFYEGRCFIAGDAAHIHSPAGGQGMNTGLQDAYNLAWKLALVINGTAPPDLLHSYQTERLPVARTLVSTTDRVFSLMVSKNFVISFLRLKLLPTLISKLTRPNYMRAEIFRRVSQIGIRYRKSKLSVTPTDGKHFPEEAPRPGDRVPFIQVFSSDYDKLVSIYSLLRNSYFTLIIFKSSFGTDRAEQLQEELETALQDYLPNLIKCHILYPHDQNHGVYGLFGIVEDAFYLIRPDNYIAFRSQPADTQSLLNYLTDILQLQPLPPNVNEPDVNVPPFTAE
ncbi:oxygenase [Adhaeribacter aerolatus]|uniref:Oxygenase n=1 Tax=Adhaeribacter aerolatus TaxID=670289 RepID=A0A512AYS1_9BACT|nr:FAD-dependent monooxygenase [Adhaeribacter aerolatus]GEO04868.1 oxygenase [Adhaeribacter aerolatus]